jgi:hypothetical protein
MQSETSFIAETDELGQPVWVWQYDGARGFARPVVDAASAIRYAETASIWGAPRDTVLRWLTDLAATDRS